MSEEVIISMRPFAAAGISLLGALVIICFGNRVAPNVRESWSVLAALGKGMLVFSMVPAVLSGKVYQATLFQVAEGIGLTLRTDPAGMVFACLASFLWILTTVYSIGYMRGHREKNQTGYYACFALCLCATIGISFAANLATFFVFFEMLTLATYPLVVHYRDGESRRAGRKYLAYTLISGQVMLFGILCIYALTGRGDFTPGGFLSGGTAPSWAMEGLFAAMVLAGAVKAGIMPVHGWLPDAMVAPTPVSALLHAVAVVKAGGFCIIRMVGYVFGPALSARLAADTLLALLAAATILAASLIAMRQDHLKRRLAYSTIGQLSYVALGAALLAPVSMAGALFHIVAHGLLKITMFMCAGAVFVRTHKAYISQMRGVGRSMPLVMGLFAVASFGIAGMPFLPAFISKLEIGLGAYETGHPAYLAVLAASSLLSLAYFLPVVWTAFSLEKTGEIEREDNKDKTGEEEPAMQRGLFPGWDDTDWRLVLPPLLTVSAAVILGIWPNAGAGIFELAAMAAKEMGAVG